MRILSFISLTLDVTDIFAGSGLPITISRNPPCVLRSKLFRLKHGKPLTISLWLVPKIERYRKANRVGEPARWSPPISMSLRIPHCCGIMAGIDPHPHANQRGFRAPQGQLFRPYQSDQAHNARHRTLQRRGTSKKDLSRSPQGHLYGTQLCRSHRSHH